MNSVTLKFLALFQFERPYIDSIFFLETGLLFFFYVRDRSLVGR